MSPQFIPLLLQFRSAFPTIRTQVGMDRIILFKNIILKFVFTESMAISWAQFALLLLVTASCRANDTEEEDGQLYEETVVLKTRLGSLRGRREILVPEDESSSGRFYFAFKGIRYAKPPSNERRFQVNNTKKKTQFQVTVDKILLK